MRRRKTYEGSRCAVPYRQLVSVAPSGSWILPRTGFTLIELMVVVAIIGILATLTTSLFSATDSAERLQAKGDIVAIQGELDSFEAEHGGYPDSLATVGKEDFLDPWGNPYRYLRLSGRTPGSMGKARKDKFLVPINSDYDLYSCGPDGESQAPLTAKASRDDIIRASDGAYVGPASKY